MDKSRRFMDERKEFRLPSKLLDQIAEAVTSDPEKYFNASHFMRIAAIKEIRANNKEVKKTWK